jgi:pyruvate/oxaloacetate carboxyltransferase
LEARAAEQIRLQEYARTYGVRPANIAELERMEAERQRREIETRQADQERRRREEDKRRWEEEVRRASESVTYNIQQAQNAERLKAEQARELKFREEQLLLELQYAGTDAARQRIELQIRQLRELRGQP